MAQRGQVGAAGAQGLQNGQAGREPAFLAIDHHREKRRIHALIVVAKSDRLLMPVKIAPIRRADFR